MNTTEHIMRESIEEVAIARRKPPAVIAFYLTSSYYYLFRQAGWDYLAKERENRR